MRTPLLLLILVLGTLALPGEAQKRRPDPGPQPKNIHGVVQDVRGKPLASAHVFVRDVKTNVTRTLTTDQQGLYSIYALSPANDYEVYADFKGKSSEKKFVSTFLNRQDNVLNFQIDIAAIEGGILEPDTASGPSMMTYDMVELHASFDLPQGAAAPIPSVLLLHGYGEDRTVWDALKKELLLRGWAVMALDLRGHGDSKVKNGRPMQVSPEWRTNPHEFPVDLDPVLDWLKAQERINNGKIAIIGSDVGANLALVASGRFPEIRTVVAINPKLSESLALAGSAQDFRPQRAFVVAADGTEGNRVKSAVALPSRLLVVAGSGGTAKMVGDKQVVDGIFAWLKETF